MLDNCWHYDLIQWIQIYCILSFNGVLMEPFSQRMRRPQEAARSFKMDMAMTLKSPFIDLS
jgi:hypothetical protein